MSTKAGRKWSSEWSEYIDPFTGVLIHQLTNYKGHSMHLYFTENGWYDSNQRLLFVSDRENCTNLFSLSLITGDIIQLTDLGPGIDGINPCLSPNGRYAYFSTKYKIYQLELSSLQLTVIHEEISDFQIGQISCTADGKYVITTLSEDMSRRFRVDLGNGYVGHREIMDAKPHSRILLIPTSGGTPEVVFEENDWIGHINASPTNPDMLTFCHEGPWDLVDHRIWGFDIRTREPWKIRGRFEPGEKVGHEYWLADGNYIGYHGFRANGTAFFGTIRYDNMDINKVEFAFRNWHANSYGLEQVVVDGRAPSDALVYWRKEDGEFKGPKHLCQHRCSFHSQKVHAHPRFSPDGTKLLFTSDKNSYGNLYLVELPTDIQSLPDYKLNQGL